MADWRGKGVIGGRIRINTGIIIRNRGIIVRTLHLRRVDDGSSKERSKDSSIADSEGATVHVFDTDVILLGLGPQGSDRLQMS